MATTTITMSAGTWYKDNDTINHSSDSWLKSVWDGGPDRKDTMLCYQAMVQFLIPSNLKYKRIKRASLNFYTRSIWNGYE